jgi:1,4-alpha-glucan branching enzyme
MIKVKPEPKIKRRKVHFSVESAGAREVFLMGDFNNWNPKTHPMKNNGSGTWSKSVILRPGKYEYKFYIDGEWKEDPRNDQTCRNGFGTQNSVLNLTEF